jgi:hypothetical protein
MKMKLRPAAKVMILSRAGILVNTPRTEETNALEMTIDYIWWPVTLV